MIQRIVRKALWGLFFFAFFEKFFVPILTSGGPASFIEYETEINRNKCNFKWWKNSAEHFSLEDQWHVLADHAE